jgi:subtilase family serine protease
VTLRGNVRPFFQPDNDQGPVADSLLLENITLMFKPTEDQQTNLSALVEQQQDPTSPLYHHWLTPEQFADSFGLSRSDLSKVVAWLQSWGFTVTQAARSRLWISFTGTAGQVRSAFQTEIDNFSVWGKTYYGIASEPALPAALADVVLGFHALDNYGLKPRSVFRRVADGAEGPQSGPFDRLRTRPERSEGAGSVAFPDDAPQPHFTSEYSGNNYLSPADFATIYDLNALYNNGIDGTGQSIAVMGETDLYNNGSDIATFRSLSGLPAINLTQKLIPGASDPGILPNDINEASLDVEWSGAVAKNAAIIFVNGGSNGVFNAFQYAIDQNLAPVITISYGACESSWPPSELQGIFQVAQQANAQGITIMAATGDSGAADCDSSTPTNLVTSAVRGLAVDAPASLPDVTAMGGTEFNEGAGVYWLPTTTAQGDLINSGLSYIPEMAWNDTSTSNGLLAGGGGASIKFSKPAWQTGTGVPNDNARDVPDLAMNASPVHDGYLVCVSGKCVNGFRDNSSPTPLLTAAGGTSAAAPAFAGIVALINQHAGSAQGNINPTLYAMAASSPAGFHDITTGNNIVPCTPGSTDCPATAPFQIGYTAGVGYNLATGLGSIDAYNLVMAWGSPGGGNLPAPTLLTPATGATSVALTPTFSWSPVTGNAGYRIFVATSPGALTTNPAVSTCSASACVISETTPTNSTSYTPATGVLSANTLYYWQVQALESSSSPGNAAWSVASVFNTGTPDFSLSASPSNLAISPGRSGTSTLSVTPTDNLNVENVTLTCSVAGALAGVTCTPGSVDGLGSATITITFSSTAMSYPALPRYPRFGGGWLAGVALLGFMLIGLSRRRPGGALAAWRSLQPVALGVVLASLITASFSCGGGSGGGGGGSTTPYSSKSGIVTVTGTSSTTNHTTQITVTVN